MTTRSIRRKSELDAHDRVPRYLQVASALRQRIKTGKWAVGDKIATVISCDLPGLGRLRPGDRVRFETVSLEDAAQARREAQSWFSRLCKTIAEVKADPGPDEELLYSENIIGGVVHATDMD